MPTFPELCCTTNCDVPTASPPVEMVDVAVVLVALKLPKVGVLVAVMTPEESVERRELMATPDKVMVGVEKVEVAIKPPNVPEFETNETM